MQKFQNSWTSTETRAVLSGMTVPEMAEALEKRRPGKSPLPPYRVKQIFSRIGKGALSFEEMTSLPLSLREELRKSFVVRGSRVSEKLEDRDGTVKLKFLLADGAAVEAVLLKAEDSSGDRENPQTPEQGGRFTACLSTQAGCPMGCVFCKTGSLGFLRNLETSEIVEQFLALSDLAESLGDRISRIVVMGMGEPLLNLPALRKALDIISSFGNGGFSKRKITLSSAGIYRGILDMAENGPPAELALSLTTAREDLRRRLMPGAYRTADNSLEAVKEALGVFQKKQGRRLTLEAVLLGGINTEKADAEAMARFAKGLYTVVNLIPWNPVEGLSFEGKSLREPPAEEIDMFRGFLEQAGLKTTRRYRRGRGICGACGQLGSPALTRKGL